MTNLLIYDNIIVENLIERGENMTRNKSPTKLISNSNSNSKVAIKI